MTFLNFILAHEHQIAELVRRCNEWEKIKNIPSYLFLVSNQNLKKKI